MIRHILRRVKQFLYILYFYLTKNRSVFLRILKCEVENYLNDCCNLGLSQVEELQNILFHINSYLETPEAIRITMFPDVAKDFKCLSENGLNIFSLNDNKRKLRKKYPVNYSQYIQDVEKQRAVERVCILESLKNFPFDPVF